MRRQRKTGALGSGFGLRASKKSSRLKAVARQSRVSEMAAGAPKQLILWAEDNDNDALLFQRALKAICSSCSIHRVRNGEQAIQYLEGNGPYADRTKYPLPQLLLLDLNMPGKSGLDVLEWRRSGEQFQKIPAVILSSSLTERDQERAKTLGARECLGKPTQPTQIRFVMRSLTEMTVQDASLPS